MYTLVTRYPVPAATLLEWKPRISLAQDPAMNKDSSVDDSDNDTPSPTFSTVPLPSNQRSLRRRHDRSEDEVEQDIISISSMSGKKFDFCIEIDDLTVYLLL